MALLGPRPIEIDVLSGADRETISGGKPHESRRSGTVSANLWARDGLVSRIRQLLSPLLAGCVSFGIGAASSASAPGPTQTVLQSFPAPPRTYELTQEACSPPRPDADEKSRGCAFGVSLLEGGKVQDRALLGAAGCDAAEPDSVTLELGADPDAKAWLTRDEHCHTAVGARTVELAPKVTALLVTEQQGFEYRFRFHWLFLPRNGKLETLWNLEEGDLATQWTRTAVIPGVTGKDIALIEVDRTFKAVTVRVAAQRLHFDPPSGKVVSSPLPDKAASLFVLQVEGARHPYKAIAAQECLGDFVVLRGALFPGLKLPASFPGVLFASRAHAEAALAALAQCGVPTKAKIVEYTSSGAKSHAEHH
jgi:hypothetical protein